MQLAFRSPRATSLLAVSLVLGCGTGDRHPDSAGGNVAAERARTVDTGNALSVTPAEGGVAKLTPTDAKSVNNATKYELTDDNFHKFIAATDSVIVLRARDPRLREFLDQDITDVGNGILVEAVDAGRKRLENNPAVSNAINSAGLSVRDYFVAAIAIAQAERFMGNPRAAIPTATLKPNAEFLNAHRGDLTALRARQNGAIIVRP